MTIRTTILSLEKPIGVLSFIQVNWYAAKITSSSAMAVHSSSIESSPELPVSNGG